MRRRIYICGPISRGNLQHNVNQATEAFVALAKAGFVPFCPQWSTYSKPAFRNAAGSVWCEATVNGNDEMTHADWMGVDLPWVGVSEAVLRLPGESAGADMEVECAREHGIPVFHEVGDLIMYFMPTAAVTA